MVAEAINNDVEYEEQVMNWTIGHTWSIFKNLPNIGLSHIA